jgi:CRP/FNR family transcriptional regulator, cyclic AMP receptor protein
MSLQQEVELLRNIPLFSKIDPSKLKLLAFTSERLAYQDDQVLFSQGDTGDAAYIIMNGAAAILIETQTGPIEVARLKKGDVVGEIAILCDVPRTATVQAKDSLTTLKVTKDTFFRLVTEFPQIAVEIMRELAARLEQTNAKLREAHSAKQAS